MASGFDLLHHHSHAGPVTESEVDDFLRQVRSNISGPKHEGVGLLDRGKAYDLNTPWEEAAPLFAQWASSVGPHERAEVIRRALTDFWSESGDQPQGGALETHLVSPSSN